LEWFGRGRCKAVVIKSYFCRGRCRRFCRRGFIGGALDLFQFHGKGKQFDRKKATGINVFLENGKKKEEFPFKT
jgi:hypothetical protein